MSPVLMNFIDSKIAYQLGKPWACDRCHSTQPPPLEGSPLLTLFCSHLLQTLQPNDLRLPRNLPLLSELPISKLQPQPQALLLALASCPVPMSRVAFCSEEATMTWIWSWNLQEEVHREASYVPAPPTTSPTLGRASPRHTCQVSSLGPMVFPLWPYVLSQASLPCGISWRLLPGSLPGLSWPAHMLPSPLMGSPS